MNKHRIEEIATRAVGDYIDDCPKLKAYCRSNDKIPIWDGDIIIYKSKEEHNIKNIFARVPLQIKGTTNTEDDYYRIRREYIEAYRADGGCVFFLVQIDKETYKLIRILYAMLSWEFVNALLQQKTKIIKIDLKEAPANPLDFEKELIQFADARNRTRILTPESESISSLKSECEKLRDYYSIDSNKQKELLVLLDAIKRVDDNESDKLIYFVQKVIAIAENDKVDNPYLLKDIATKFALFLKDQSQYGLAEEYYKIAINYAQIIVDKHPESIETLTDSRDNLENLYKDVGYQEGFEALLKKSLNNHLATCKTNPSIIEPLANVYYEFAEFYERSKKHRSAEEHYINALNIYEVLTDSNNTKHTDRISEILMKLYAIHILLNDYSKAKEDNSDAKYYYENVIEKRSEASQVNLARVYCNSAQLNESFHDFKEAEKDAQKSMDILELLKNSKDKAELLADLADLYSKMGKYEDAEKIFEESLERFDHLEDIIIPKAKAIYLFANHYERINNKEEAEKKYKEALRMQDKIVDLNDYALNASKTLLALANMYQDEKPSKAEKEYEKVLELHRSLAKNDPEAFTADVAMTLNNLAGLHSHKNNLADAEKEYKESLDIRRELAKSNPDVYLAGVATTLNNLAMLHSNINQIVSAELEYREALKIFRKLAKSNPDAYRAEVAKTLYHIALLLNRDAYRKDEAKHVGQEALELFREAEKITPHIWNSHILSVQQLLNEIRGPKH